MPDPGPRPPSSPIRVTPTYTPGGGGDCHVHHSDGLVAVLVGLSNPELAGPLLTRLQNDLGGTAGAKGWLDASRTEPVAGAAVGVVGSDGALEIGWWGRTDVQVTTDYGFETHTGGEEPRTITIDGGTPVRIVPRAVHTTSGSNLERGTVMASGCVVALTPQPTTPDVMPEAAAVVVGEPAADATPVASGREEPARPPEPDTTGPAPAVPEPPIGLRSMSSEELVGDDGVVLVRGLRCRNGHHNHPEARLCSLCGDAMQNVSIFVGRDGVLGELGERPPLGIITLDDGQAYQIGHDVTVLGRSPVADGPNEFAVPFPDDDTMSRAHLVIELQGWKVFVRDLGSSNGTGVRFPDSDTYVRLEPDRPYPLPSDTVLVFGRRWCTFTATSAAPAAR